MTREENARPSFRPAFIKCCGAIGIWVVCICLTELILSQLPVSLGPRQVRTDAAHPYIHYTPGAAYVYSVGPLFDGAVAGRVNNAGFVNVQSYESPVSVPLVAVIGDSYVEAEMLPYAESINGRLARAVGPNGRVYSFAISSAAASQYLAYARMAAEQYHPDYTVICLNSSDFYESLLTRWPSPGLWQFDDRPQGEFSMHLTPYRAQPIREMLQVSALARYVARNLLLTRLFTRSLAQLPQALAFRAADLQALIHLRPCPPVLSAEDTQTGPDARKAADVFLQRLSSDAHLPPRRILLVFDASHPYGHSAGGAAGSPDAWAIEKQRVIRQARALGFLAVDLQPRFVEEFVKTGRALGIPGDGHWNALGHAIVANEIVHMLDIQRGLTKYTVARESRPSPGLGWPP